MTPHRFRTIVADPPWQYNKAPTELRSGGRGAAAEHHYGTLTNAEIAALPVACLAAGEAHLYLWVTNPRLYRARKPDGVGPIDIAEAWGFKYKTLLTWVKTGAPGPGWYFRGYTEHVLFATRGGLQIPAALRQPNVFTAPRGRHSTKPDAFYDRVVDVSPAPRLELFARDRRVGWSAWGNEVDSDVEMAA